MRDEIRNTNIEIRNKFELPKFKTKVGSKAKMRGAGGGCDVKKLKSKN